MTVKEKIKVVLTELPEMRDSDKKLLLYVWRRQGLELTPAQEQIFLTKCMTAESITRARRIVQEENANLRGSEAVQEERHQKAVDYKYNAQVHLETDNIRDKALSLFKD